MSSSSNTPTLRVALLTFSLIGLQFTWSVEMTYFTPYLLELGLAKSQTALVWLAPPLSGMIVQPIIGTLSDSSTWKWGRRRPYMFSGSCSVAVFLLTLGWAPEICRAFIEDEAMAKKATVTLAIFCIYALDFAINVVQATSRSLIVDILPLSQQQLGSAWAGRMLGLGHLLGYAIGTLELSLYFGDAIGSSQFKRISVIASATLVFSVTVTCYFIKERAFQSPMIDDASKGTLQLLANIFKTALHLPRKIQALCWITFWTWIGWSPFFVYGTTWVGELYYRQNKQTAAELRVSTDVAGDIARKGSLALVLFSVTSFAGSICWPWIVSTPQDHGASPLKRATMGSRFVPSILRTHQLDITTAWGLSQLLFAISMVLAPFPKSFRFASIIIALCGLPWAMYGWAPLALLGEEINKLDAPVDGRTGSTSAHEEGTELNRLSLDSSHPSEAMALTQDEHEPSSANGRQSAGVYLGIWNIYATIPQFVASFIAMTAFSILEPGKSLEWAHQPEGAVDPSKGKLSGTAACLVIGAVCSFVAALLTFRLRKI